MVIQIIVKHIIIGIISLNCIKTGGSILFVMMVFRNEKRIIATGRNFKQAVQMSQYFSDHSI